MTQSLDLFLERLQSRNRLYWPSVQKNLERNEHLFRELGATLTEWASAHLGPGFADTLVDGYVRFVTDVNRSQVEYERRGAYAAKTYAEVYEAVYGSNEAMSSYHWGVFVTTFAWEHHLGLWRFFRDEFLTRLGETDGHVLDLGAGSGVWHLLTLERLQGWRAHAVDISPTSVEIAKQMCAAARLQARASYQVADATNVALDREFDAGISCFLLEHLEDPQRLLEKLAQGIRSRQFAFVTAALTAAEKDHIREFRRESEICALAEDAGFRVVAMHSAAPPAYPPTRRFLPRSLALMLQKRGAELW